MYGARLPPLGDRSLVSRVPWTTSELSSEVGRKTRRGVIDLQRRRRIPLMQLLFALFWLESDNNEPEEGSDNPSGSLSFDVKQNVERVVLVDEINRNPVARAGSSPFLSLRFTRTLRRGGKERS